jgi:hypothetical protein
MNKFKNVQCTGKEFVRELLLGKLLMLKTKSNCVINTFTLPGITFNFEHLISKIKSTIQRSYEIDSKVYSILAESTRPKLLFYSNESIEKGLRDFFYNSKIYYNNGSIKSSLFVWCDWCGSLTEERIKFMLEVATKIKSPHFVLAFTVFGARESLATQNYMMSLMGKKLTTENRLKFKNEWLLNTMLRILKKRKYKITSSHLIKYTPSTSKNGAPMYNYIISGSSVSIK